MAAILKDVARKAKVSVSTASYALNNRPEIKSETRKKVLQAAKELQYTINGNARDLRRGATRVCALVLSSISGPYYSKLIRGVEAASADAAYDVIVTTTNQIYRNAPFRIMEEGRADGYLVFSQFIDEELIHKIGSRNPIVLIDRTSTNAIVSSVTVDNFTGAKQATHYLIDSGHRNILFLAGSIRSYHNQERLNGFTTVMKEHGLSTADVIYADFDEQKSYELLTKRFRNAALPDAIMSANDQMVLGAYHAAREASIAIPHDISVIGFDDADFSRYIVPSLTTIRQPAYLQGKKAAEKLFAILNGNDHPGNENPLPTELIHRDSVQHRYILNSPSRSETLQH